MGNSNGLKAAIPNNVSAPKKATAVRKPRCHFVNCPPRTLISWEPVVSANLPLFRHAAWPSPAIGHRQFCRH